jgi:ribose transport system substrate-binding protein
VNTSLRRRRTGHRAVAVLAIAGVGLAACGDDDDSAAGTEAAPATTEATTDTTAAPDTTEATTDTTAAPDTTEATTDTTAAAAGGDAEPMRIGFLPPGLEIPAFQGLWHGLEGYGGERYGDEIVAVDAKFDPTTQVQTIEQWVQLEQVDGIWVIPVVAEAITPALEAATDAGIVVIAGGVPSDYGFDSPPPGMTFANIDNEQFGVAIGEMMADCVDERLGGEAQLLYIGSGEGSISVEDINNGSKDTLAEQAPGAEIVQELTAIPNDVAGTQGVIESALQANPDAQGLMAGDAESTMAALNVFTSAGKSGQDICIVGNGGTEDQIAAVAAGDVFGVVAFDFEADLMQNVDELHAMSLDPTAEGQVLTIPVNRIGG